MSKRDLSDTEVVSGRPQKTLKEVSLELAETQKALENAQKCVELWQEEHGIAGQAFDNLLGWEGNESVVDYLKRLQEKSIFDVLCNRKNQIDRLTRLRHPDRTRNRVMHPHDKAQFILDNLTDITDDEKRLCRDIKDDSYFGSPMSVRKLHELQVLFHQTEGFVRARSFPLT